MKKLSYLLLGAVGLLFASCSQEEVFSPGNADGTSNVTINLTTPKIDTRAYSDGTTATQLQYAVYSVAGEGDAKTFTKLDAYTVKDETIKLNKKVSFQLVTGSTYAFVFWAGNADAPYTVTFDNDGASLEVDYEGVKANNEKLDAFYTVLEYTVKGDAMVEAHLYRPFAQINVGTNDYEVAKAGGYDPTVSRIKISNVYNQLDLMTGEVDGGASVEFGYGEIQKTEAFPVDNATYDYMVMTYALVAKDQETVNVEFDCSTAEEGGVVRAEHKVGSVPVQRNYRTNIFGALLTSTIDVNVIIEPAFKDDDYDVDMNGLYLDEESKTYTVTSAQGLAKMRNIANELAASGKSLNGYTILLDNDIYLSGTWTPMNNNQAIFDGQNHTIYGLYVDETSNKDASAGLFSTGRGTVKNFTLVDPVVKGNYKAGAVAGDGLCTYFENITVSGAKVTSFPWKKDGTVYDDGNNAGGIVGYFSAEGNGHITGCTVENSTITAYRKVGGITGYAGCYASSQEKELKGNTVKDTKVVANMLETNYDGYATRVPDAGKLVGTTNANYTANEDDNTVENVEVIVLKYQEDGKSVTVSDIAGMQTIASMVGSGETFKGKTITLDKDLDLEGMEWTPIGNTSNSFQGTFDGGGKTISNIKVSSGNYVGLFGNTLNAKISNIKIHNADIKGRLGVAIIAGHPYTTNIEGIEITGKVTVEGSFYVATVGGGNMCYGNYKDITVNVEPGSYVKANSVENGKAYASYAGGVIGHPGEGGYVYENIESNIDVYASTVYVGGIIGLAHYGSTFKNCKSTGNIYVTDAEDKSDGSMIGGIAGCWNAGGANVTFERCSFEGKLFSNQFTEEELSGLNYSIVGNVWGNGGEGRLLIDGADATESHYKISWD